MDLPLVRRIQDHIHHFLNETSVSNQNLQPFLEVGCGDGINLEALASWGYAGVGLDISSPALKQARERDLRRIDLLEADFLETPIQQYPFILLLNTLEHIPEDRKFLQKTALHLKEEGWFVLAVPTQPKSYGFADFQAGHCRRYDRKQVVQLLTETGFEVKKIVNVGYPVCNLYTWAYNRLAPLLAREPSGGIGRIKEENTPHTGIEKNYSHFPSLFRWVAPFCFYLFSKLISLDRFFVRTQLGNNEIYFARRVRSP